MSSCTQTKTIPDLPAEIRDEILAYWDPIVLANFSLCCKLHHSIVSEFTTRHYGVQHAYGKYFTLAEIGQLQDLQADTGLIAYGPTVLNFFTQASFRSPLDTVCQLHHCLSVGLWYMAKEYAYEPEQSQLESFESDVVRVKELLRQSNSDEVDEMADFQEVLSGIVQTWSFYKGCKHIRLVASSGSPLEVVFSQPSTCLMNVFTHRAAYCLFPQLTLVDDIALINSVDVTTTDDQVVHIANFSRLGFTFLKMPSIAMTTNPDSALSFLCARSVGDRHCHVVKFDHFGTADPKPDFIEAHSWNMSYHLDATSLTYMPLGTNHSKFEYTIAPQLWDSTIAKLITLGRLEQRCHLNGDMSILCSQVLSRAEVFEDTKKNPMWATYHSVLSAAIQTGCVLGSDTAHELFTLLFTILERYQGSSLTIEDDASNATSTSTTQVSLTLSIPGGQIDPAELPGLQRWLHFFRSSNVLFNMNVLE